MLVPRGNRAIDGGRGGHMIIAGTWGWSPPKRPWEFGARSPKMFGLKKMAKKTKPEEEEE